jgi:hypothetical protein
MVMVELCKGEWITLENSFDSIRLAEKRWDS